MASTLHRNFPSRFPGTCNACGCRFPTGTMITYSKGIGARHETQAQCDDAKRERAAAPPDAPTLDISPIADFLRAAQARGLKAPKLRVLAPDGKTELRLSMTRTGRAPGSISVVLGDVYIGCIRPVTNAMTGEFSQRTELHSHLLVVAKDPITAARTYAAVMCRCSFCGLQLTDAGSVEVGYGPICAGHWGLPHKPKGTPALHPVNGQTTLPLGAGSR